MRSCPRACVRAFSCVCACARVRASVFCYLLHACVRVRGVVHVVRCVFVCVLCVFVHVSVCACLGVCVCLRVPVPLPVSVSVSVSTHF